MKKLMSILLAAVMLFSVCAVTSSAWDEGDYPVVIADAVNYRYGPGTNYGVVPGVKATYGVTFAKLSSVNVSTDSNGKEWLSTTNGWICMDYIRTYFSPADYDYGTINASGVAVRQGPTTKAPSLGSYSKNTNINLLGKTHSLIDGHLWYQVNYNNALGWVAADYITVK